MDEPCKVLTAISFYLPSTTYQKSLDRKENGADLQGGGPLVLEDVEADAAELVDVRMIHLGQEADLGGSHRVVRGEK